MADRKRSIEVDFLVDDRDKRKFKGIGDDATRAGKGIDILKGAVGGLVAAIGVREIAQFGLDAAKMAEQAQLAGESASKVLGPALDGLHERLETTRETLGLNIGELDTIVAKFGLLTEGFNLSDDAQAAFIEKLIETGGELAAFRGNVGEAPEAIDAMGAALRGEYDSLEQFGVKLSEAAIKERELELKADPATASLSDQELRILALQQLIDEKAEPAFGSLAEAQDTLAGKTNAAGVKFDDMKMKLGEKLLPILMTATEGVIDLFEAIETGGESGVEWADKIVDSWNEVEDIFQDINDFLMQGSPDDNFLETTLDDFEEIVEGIKTAWEWLDKFQQKLGDALHAWASQGGTLRNQSPGGGGNRGSVGGDSNFSNRRAIGGDVHPGNAYQINERGQEVFVPNSAGTIVPASGAMVNITINAGLGSDPNAISKAVVEALQRYQRANGAIPISVRG